MSLSHVIIIGAGVGGLAVAQGLRKRNISFSVHERDVSLDSRRQGNRIKIGGDVKDMLQKLIPPEVFTVLEETCAATFLGETNLNASDASITACRRGRLPPGISPPLTADRGLLREALMTGISDSVHFGQAFERYEELEGKDGGGRYVRVFFTDASSRDAALLLGADGSRSQVRQQLIKGPSYICDTDTCCVYGKTPLTPSLQQQFPASHRRWITLVRDEAPLTQKIIFGDGPVVMVLEACHFSNRDAYPDLPDDYVHWGILFHRSLLRLPAKQLDKQLQKGAQLALDLTADWHPSIRCLCEMQDSALTVGTRIFSAPLKIPTWTSSSVVTILGDAAHTMSPAGGVGAVGALHDASQVVEMVAEGHVSAESIGEFEGRMRGFAETLLQRTDEASKRMLGVGLADGSVERAGA